ncbi:hypothetical protein BGW36DRAFT_364255 [Talaromyces proteolyticus]|uniref:Rhodopsin domain-containing protein n=1 Tax=Talaromyces proteolyticus TaxID=1131652 RepID=A0AAD4KKS2_9EURO|nr:uncharacterized protein BGW36DRAFT_364255 [Talaromyces proteolyticus]KAH8690688.1 hypothetical protein BGW36DRAFT_364255 [Talaromyces proteolyticus]
MSSSSSPPPYPDHDNGPAVNGVTWSFLAVAVICVALRCYVRLMVVKNFGYDDVLIVVTLGVLIAGDVVLSNMVSAGMGRHLIYLPDPTHSALEILKWNAIYQILNVSGALITKMSIGFFLLRLKQSRKFSLAIWGVLTPLIITTLVLCFVVGLQCIPLRALWTPTIKGRCMSEKTPLNVSYVQSAFAILADLFLTGSPIVILWKIQISLKKKIAICALMSLGLMATIANALRNAFIPNLTAEDETYTIVPIVIVAELEFSVGTIAACIPTLMPLFKRPNQSSSYNKYNKMSGGAVPTIGSDRLRSNNSRPNKYSFTETTHASRADIGSVHSTESEIPLKSMNQENRIKLSQSFTVEHSQA